MKSVIQLGEGRGELNDEKAFGAGLIHPTIPDVEGTEPRLSREWIEKMAHSEEGHDVGAGSESEFQNNRGDRTMTIQEIKAYAEQMIAVAEVGGKLEPQQRVGVVVAAMQCCGTPQIETGNQAK